MNLQTSSFRRQASRRGLSGFRAFVPEACSLKPEVCSLNHEVHEEHEVERLPLLRVLRVLRG